MRWIQRIRSRSAFWILMLSLSGPGLSWAITYTAEAISASIVDKDTGAPLAGVHVVATWELRGGLEGGNVLGYVTVLETVTDSQGRFFFEKWGPKSHTGRGRVGWGAPWLILFKPGYYPRVLGNQRDPPESGFLSSAWNQQRVEMRRFDGSIVSYSEQFSVVESVLSNLARDPQCHWRAAPKFIVATQKQNEMFRNEQAHQFVGYPSLDSMARRCGGLQRYVESRTP